MRAVLITVINAALVKPSFLGVLTHFHRAGNTPQPEKDFVLDCVGVTNVQFEEYLPLSAVRTVCEGVDLRTECAEFADTLVATFNSDRDYTKWCSSFYGWFKQQYGSLCPDQCDKFMCVPKCKWLDRLAELDAAEAELAKDEEAHRATLKEVRAVESSIQDREYTVKSAEKKLELSKGSVEYAQKGVAEHGKARAEAVNATQRTEAKAAKADAKLEDVESRRERAEQNKTEQQWALDSKRVTAESAHRASRRAQQLGEESVDDLKHAQDGAVSAEKKAGEADETLHEKESALASAKETVAGERSGVQKKLDDANAESQEQDAEMARLQAIVNKTHDNEMAVEMLKVLHKETEQAADKQVEELAKVAEKERKLRDNERDLKYVRKDLASAEDKLVEAVDRERAANQTATETQSETADSLKHAASLDADIAEAEQGIKQTGVEIEQLAKEKQTAQVTAEFAHQAVAEKQVAVDKASARIASADAKLREAEDAVASRQLELERENGELAQLRGEANETLHSYDVAVNRTAAASEALAAERDLAVAAEPPL